MSFLGGRAADVAFEMLVTLVFCVITVVVVVFVGVLAGVVGAAESLTLLPLEGSSVGESLDSHANTVDFLFVSATEVF